MPQQSLMHQNWLVQQRLCLSTYCGLKKMTLLIGRFVKRLVSSVFFKDKCCHLVFCFQMIILYYFIAHQLIFDCYSLKNYKAIEGGKSTANYSLCSHDATILIITLHIMAILITLNTCGITYNDITYN